MKVKISKSERKQYFGTNCLFAIFFSFYSPFIITYSPFSGEAHFLLLTSLLVLKDLQPSRADKASRPCLGISLKKIELG